jgi:hypothetical protein
VVFTPRAFGNPPRACVCERERERSFIIDNQEVTEERERERERGLLGTFHNGGRERPELQR